VRGFDTVSPLASGSAWWRPAAIAIVAGCAIVSALLGWVYWHQEELLFHPEALAPGYQFGLPDVQEERIEVAGATLSALHLKLPRPRGVVFFLHGNSGNLATWFTNSDFYRRANYDLFMIDYRGFGKTTGRIESEAQLRSDVLAAWQHVAPQYAGKRKVIYGRSLGTGLAAGLATQVQADLTILVSPYCSMAEIMRRHYPLLPTFVLRYPLATCDDVGRIQGSLLLVHGDQDELIPISQSERLLELAPHARLLRIRGAGHSDVHQFGTYTDTLLQLLRAL
jgi:hypothetical protein